MTSNTRGIVLIHGAGLGPYIWDTLITMLNQPVLPIAFPNRELGATSNTNLELKDYLDNTIEQINNWGIQQFIIVAHSIGGCIALGINDHFNNRVKGFIGVSAIIPQKGKSFASCFPFPQSFLLPILLKLFGTNPPDKSIKAELCNDLNNPQTEEIIRRFTPESIKLYTSKINYNSIPNSTMFVRLSNDQAITLKMQDDMIKNLLCQNIVDLNTGHLPMMSNPEALAKIINSYMESLH